MKTLGLPIARERNRSISFRAGQSEVEFIESPPSCRSGAERGLLIVVKAGRMWMPTDDVPAAPAPDERRRPGAASGAVRSRRQSCGRRGDLIAAMTSNRAPSGVTSFHT